MTKEEIRNNHMTAFWKSDWEHNEYSGKTRNDVELIMMQEYADQFAAEFAEWIMNNYYETNDNGLWYKWAINANTDKLYTTSELIEIFKQSK